MGRIIRTGRRRHWLFSDISLQPSSHGCGGLGRWTDRGADRAGQGRGLQCGGLSLVSRHRSSVGLRWPSERLAAVDRLPIPSGMAGRCGLRSAAVAWHRWPIRSVWAARCALRCAPMAARSLRHLIGGTTLAAHPLRAALRSTSSQTPFSVQAAPAIFKAYDIRGIVPSTLDEALARGLGRAFGSAARAQGQRTVAVGRDGRLSGPALAAALIEGLVEAGIAVIDVGQVTTPLLYFAASTLCASGIQVTGSHNPRDYNGFKMVLAGRTIHGEEIQGLRRCMEQESWQLRPGGSVRHADVLPAYHERIVGDVRLARPMKIVLDCGNGIAGASTPALLRALGCEVIELFSQVDGNFPNHHPDPSKPENLRDLIAALQGSDAELGLALDGDGDRLGIVTRDGHNIFADRQLMLLAQDVLARVPGAEIIFDVKCSQRLAPAIEAAGGVPVMHQTGHSLIKARMQQGNAPLGGEMSGHIFFKERW